MKLAKIFALLALLLGFLSAPPKSARAGHVKKASVAMLEETANHSLVDLNSASKSDLEELPGIGKVYAQKIIDGRPYRAKTDLVKRKIISRSTYEKIHDRVVARQASPK
jgi:competence protein ComEA